MKALIAYFSASGSTAGLASRLAKATGGDLFEIQPQAPYTSADLDWTNKRSRSSVEMSDPSSRPPILSVPDASSYDVVFVGFPIWWYKAPTIINTLLESCDLSGKTVIPFATSGGSGMGKTNQFLAPSCKGARLLDGKVFSPTASDNQLGSWIKGLAL